MGLWREFIMTNKLHPQQFALAAIVTVLMIDSSLTAHAGDNNSAMRALAGQMCPNGSYVIGFDSGGNIICTQSCGNGVLNTGEACDDGNTETGDGCSAACQQEGVDIEGDEEELAAETLATDPGSLPSIPNPVISDVEPSSVVWGTSEVAITVIGTGFNEESVIIFEGSTYKPVVNQAGTRLDITIETANLNIGSYAIKVSNRSGLENTLKRALAVY
jgi:cysteine-rich repeat protein